MISLSKHFFINYLLFEFGIHSVVLNDTNVYKGIYLKVTCKILNPNFNLSVMELLRVERKIEINAHP
ncbi:hypothetical protein LCGC14_0758520 [marine sediment metagenome]|uniref:Uncharacterized protein n=1 Tax=marine sediment metagenome TaxID=412755 RepID=A0A0F9Q1Z2_9ZZZZ